MSQRSVKIAQIGAGGYGHFYLSEILDQRTNNGVELCSVFDPVIEEVALYNHLITKGVSCFNQLEPFLESLSGVDLVIIVSPIHHHVAQAKAVLEKGCNVLLDKPLAGSAAQGRELLSHPLKTGQWVSVGYQWSFSKAIIDLKKDLVGGRFGRIKKAKTLVFWPRDYAYYKRNNWAGKKESDEQLAINDSPANNAMAHFIHNLLFLCGPGIECCAIPQKGKAELFRAYEIETFDTAMLSIKCQKGIPIYFYGSHVTKNNKGPLFILECEKGVVYRGELSNEIVAVHNEGTTVNYGDPEDTPQFYKLWHSVKACRGEVPPLCTADQAYQQTRIIDALAQLDHIQEFPVNQIIELDSRRYVEGLGYMMFMSYQQGVLPSKKAFPMKTKAHKLNFTK